MGSTLQHLCDACGQEMRAVPMHHRDGSRTISYECGDLKCPAGPGGLMTFKLLNSRTGEVESRTTFWGDGTFDETMRGRPSKNEENVAVVAAAFMIAANRQFGTDYSRCDPVHPSSRDEAGHDCVIVSASGRNLQVQVTRVLSTDDYRKQSTHGKREVTGTTAAAADWIRDAIQRKTLKASPSIALVIDGMDVPAIGIVADLEVVARHREFLSLQNWHSVWIVGHFGLRHVAGRVLPEAA